MISRPDHRSAWDAAESAARHQRWAAELAARARETFAAGRPHASKYYQGEAAREYAVARELMGHGFKHLCERCGILKRHKGGK